MNHIVSLFMFRCGDYEKVKQDVWEENWKAMRLYSVVALVAFGVITLVSVFSLSIGKFKWVYLVYTFLSLAYFCISRCQLRSFLGKELVVYSFFAALYRTCFLCAAQPNSIQKHSGCYSVRGAEYVSDRHDDAKQGPEDPVP